MSDEETPPPPVPQRPHPPRTLVEERPRTRALGAIWLGLATAALVVFYLSISLTLNASPAEMTTRRAITGVVVAVVLIGIAMAARRASPKVRAFALAFVISVAAQIILTAGTCGLGVNTELGQTTGILNMLVQIIGVPLFGLYVALRALASRTSR
jgi:hypothetical protein